MERGHKRAKYLRQEKLVRKASLEGREEGVSGKSQTERPAQRRIEPCWMGSSGGFIGNRSQGRGGGNGDVLLSPSYEEGGCFFLVSFE